MINNSTEILDCWTAAAAGKHRSRPMYIEYNKDEYYRRLAIEL